MVQIIHVKHLAYYHDTIYILHKIYIITSNIIYYCYAIYCHCSIYYCSI